jgi:hypothetical protein
MKTKLSGVLLILLLAFNQFSIAQDSLQVKPAARPQTKVYKVAIGFQLTGLGFALFSPKGFTVKHFISERSALEYVVTPGGRNILGTSVLWQRHFPIPDARRLVWYGGAGTNLDIYRYQPVTNVTDPVKERVTTTTTFLATLGAEYSFPKGPFTLTGDIKSGIFGFSGYGPANRYNQVYGLRPSLSFRYTFSG